MKSIRTLQVNSYRESCDPSPNPPPHPLRRRDSAASRMGRRERGRGWGARDLSPWPPLHWVERGNEGEVYALSMGFEPVIADAHLHHNRDIQRNSRFHLLLDQSANFFFLRHEQLKDQ